MPSAQGSPPEPDLPRAGADWPGIRILLISDEPWWVRSIRSVLDSPNTEITDVGSGSAADRIAGTEFDAVLMHAELTEVSPLELLRLLRLQESPATVPVLLLSDQPLSREARTAALQAGVWDCLSSPLDAQELTLKLRVFIGAKRGVEKALAIGLVDLVTGLYNPQGVMRRAGELTRTSQRYGRPLACAVFSMGVAPEPATPPVPAAEGSHERRFLAEMEMALLRTLRSRRRSSDIIGKINEGEIVVLAPETDADGVLTMATRLLEATEQEMPRVEGVSHLVHAGCYAVENPQADMVDATEVIMRATKALRKAQEAPSGQVERFE